MSVAAPDIDHINQGLEELQAQVDAIDVRAYDKSRNYLDGAVTWLSPFLAHGIIDTHTIADGVLKKHKAKSCYRLLYELAWREYFHRVWQIHGDDIFDDMRQPQSGQPQLELPTAIYTAATRIEVLDDCIGHLQAKGLMHNHVRMWVAAVTCNMASTHWREAARWFHYHLLDGDLASNTLSWQWVAGTFSHKTYVANQDNINKYSKHEQSGTWLDVPYEAFDHFETPQHLRQRGRWQDAEFTSTRTDRASDENALADELLPGEPISNQDQQTRPCSGHVALYSLWQLTPGWQPDAEHRLLFIDRDWHRRWPMSEKRWQFVMRWAQALELDVRHGTVDQLHYALRDCHVHRKEYPLCRDWPGDPEPRRWLYPLPENNFESFSQFFKQVKKTAGL